MKTILVAVLFSIMLVLLIPVSYGADSILEVQSSGSSQIRDGNITQAKNAALDQALQNASIQAVQQILSPAVVTNNLQILTRSILSSGRRFVRDYRVEAEAHSKLLYIMFIRAAISADDMTKALKETGLSPIGGGEKKGILVFCEGEQYGRMIMADQLKNTATALGFEMEFEGPDFHDLSGLGVRTWADIGHQKDARFVLWCVLQVNCSESRAGKIPCKGELEFKLIDASTYTLLSSQSFSGEGSYDDVQSGKDQMAQNLGSQIAQFLRDHLSEYYLKENVTEQSLKISVRGITRYSQYDQLSRALKNSIPGVEAITLASSGGGIFEIEVRFRGSREELKAKLLEQHYDGFQLAAGGSPEGALTFQVETQSAPPILPDSNQPQPQPVQSIPPGPSNVQDQHPPQQIEPVPASVPDTHVQPQSQEIQPNNAGSSDIREQSLPQDEQRPPSNPSDAGIQPQPQVYPPSTADGNRP
jgi:hypothetical protein